MDRRPGGEGAAADGHPLPEGGIQQRLRVLHRGHEGERPSGSRRLYPEADPGQCGAVHQRGAEGVRGDGPPCGGAAAGAGIRSLRRNPGPDRRRDPADPGDGVPNRRSGCRRIAGRGGRAVQLLLSRGRRGGCDRDHGRPSSGRGADTRLGGVSSPTMSRSIWRKTAF